jgi:hypothetical protein
LSLLKLVWKSGALPVQGLGWAYSSRWHALSTVTVEYAEPIENEKSGAEGRQPLNGCDGRFRRLLLVSARIDTFKPNKAGFQYTPQPKKSNRSIPYLSDSPFVVCLNRGQP